jgi:N-acetylglucosamine repressor
MGIYPTDCIPLSFRGLIAAAMIRTGNKSNKRTRRPNSRRFKIKHDMIAGVQADLLRRIRAHEGLSRAELARGLNLAPSTIGIYVDHLIAEGFLFEGKPAERNFGRPPTILGLNPRGGRFIGVDFEARNIMAESVDFSQKPLKQFHDTLTGADSAENVLRKIEHAIETVMADDGRKVLGIGVGVPGVIDPKNGIALHYEHIRGWSDVALVGRLQGRFNLPVFLENNIRSMALAELWFGQGRGVRNFICLGVRSGIGAGIVVDGQIYHGGNNRAGEIRDWPCGIAGRWKTRATLENIISFKPIQNRVGRSERPCTSSFIAPGTEVPLEYFIQAAQAGDKIVNRFLRDLGGKLGLMLSQLTSVFDPQKIILAGALPMFGEAFLKWIEETLRGLLPDKPPLVYSALGEFNGALGAAALAVHEWRPSES